MNEIMTQKYYDEQEIAERGTVLIRKITNHNKDKRIRQ
jgi:hypothetical protein